MNKRERVTAALKGRQTDRPPVGFWFHFTGGQAVGQACIDAHLAYYNNIGVDMAKVMSDSYFEFPIPGTVKTPEDWRDLRPLGRNHPYIQEQLARARGVRAGLREDICVFYNVFAPFSSIRFGTSEDFVMESLRQDPAAVQHALEVIAEDNGTLAELLVTEAGMDGIYYCVQGGEKNRFTYDEYRARITPSDLAVLKRANKASDINILHCCGWAGIPNRLEVWQDYPVAAVNWAVHVEALSIAEGRSFFGGKAALGGFDNRRDALLYRGGEAEIKAFTRGLVEENGSTGYLIGADCTLPADIDRRHIAWVLEASGG